MSDYKTKEESNMQYKLESNKGYYNTKYFKLFSSAMIVYRGLENGGFKAVIKRQSNDGWVIVKQTK